MPSQTGSQLFIGGALKGYASRMMNNSDISLHKDRKVIEHRLKVLKFYDSYGANATKEAFGVAVVTHGGTLRCFRYLLERWDYEQATTWNGE